MHPYLLSFFGGLLIGTAVWLLIMGLGRVAGVSGAATITIPWALNEAPGSYAVQVRDAVSGVAARRSVSIPQRSTQGTP